MFGDRWDAWIGDFIKRVSMHYYRPHCSIDPPGCTDVDDALHVRRLSASESSAILAASTSAAAIGIMGASRVKGLKGGPRSLVEVGVHIADVSYFVRPNSLLDGEARDRCTSVYLVDRWEKRAVLNCSSVKCLCTWSSIFLNIKLLYSMQRFYILKSPNTRP